MLKNMPTDQIRQRLDTVEDMLQVAKGKNSAQLEKLYEMLNAELAKRLKTERVYDDQCQVSR